MDEDDFNRRYEIIKSRSSDKHFYYGVKTTGIFCRPGCSSRLPNKENTTFFDSEEEAIYEGYRPCKKCKPTERGLSLYEEIVLMVCNDIETHNSVNLKELSTKSGYSSRQLQRVFKTTTGINPSEYLSGIREVKLKSNLQKDNSITRSVIEAGYNSISQIYDNVDMILAMRPNQFKNYGDGLTLRVGEFPCYLGYALISFTDRGVATIDIGDDLSQLKDQFAKRFRKANILEVNDTDKEVLEKVIKKIENPKLSINIPLDIHGTIFQKRVWKELMKIPCGETVTYSDIAERIDQENSFRAVANACGKNSISILIPCHRVIGKSGSISGYRWGVEKKISLLESEKSDES